ARVASIIHGEISRSGTSVRRPPCWSYSSYSSSPLRSKIWVVWNISRVASWEVEGRLPVICAKACATTLTALNTTKMLAVGRRGVRGGGGAGVAQRRGQVPVFQPRAMSLAAAGREWPRAPRPCCLRHAALDLLVVLKNPDIGCEPQAHTQYR